MQTLAAFCLIADISSTALVILLTVPAIRTLLESAVRRFHGLNRYLCEFYVDQDGEANRASIAATKKKFERMFITVAVIGGGYNSFNAGSCAWSNVFLQHLGTDRSLGE